MVMGQSNNLKVVSNREATVAIVDTCADMGTLNTALGPHSCP